MKLVPIFLLAVVTTVQCNGDTNLPAWVLSANGKETNYIAQVLASGLITNATEKSFLQTVIRDDQNGRLAKSLGYIGTVAYQPLGSVQYPGEKPEPMYVDGGFTEVLNFQRMHLVFNADDPDHRRTILVFAKYSGWPGMNSHCVAIVDSQFKILDWRLNETDDMCESASLDKAGQRLVVTCRHRSGGKMDYRYDLLDNKVTMPEKEYRANQSNQRTPYP